MTHKELIVWGNREIGNNLRKIRHGGGGAGAGRTRVQSQSRRVSEMHGSVSEVPVAKPYGLGVSSWDSNGKVENQLSQVVF